MGALTRLSYPALIIHVVGALIDAGLKRALIIHLRGHSLDHLRRMGSILDIILPALDYAVFKAGVLKLMPAFAEEAAPLDKAQGTQACDPLFSQQGKQMPPQLRGFFRMNCRAAPSNPRRLCRAVPCRAWSKTSRRAEPGRARPCRAVPSKPFLVSLMSVVAKLVWPWRFFLRE